MSKQVLAHSTPTATEQCAVSTAPVTMRVRANSAPSVADHSALPAKGVRVTHLGEKNTQAKFVMMTHRQRRALHVIVSPTEPIDVDSYKVKEDNRSNPPPWIAELHLTSLDKEILLSTAAWLNDDIINASQTLLKKANPVMTGLQDVSLDLTLNFTVESHEFIQILHNGRGHWLVVSTVGVEHPEVQVFDSLYSSSSTSVKTQVAALLATDRPSISMSFMDVQMQSGSSDCGIFAIAFATALVFGRRPGEFFLVSKTCEATSSNAWSTEA